MAWILPMMDQTLDAGEKQVHTVLGSQSPELRLNITQSLNLVAGKRNILECKSI